MTTLKLKKGRPRGDASKLRPFQFPKGVSGNPGGKPFVKLAQKLSVITAHELSLEAPPEFCDVLKVPVGSTWAVLVVRRMILLAVRGDVSAARFLFECSEASKVLNVHVTEISEGRMEELRGLYLAHVEREARRLAAGPVIEVESDANVN